MTDAELDAIEARAQRAREGPWHVGRSANCQHRGRMVLFGGINDLCNVWRDPGIDVTDPCAHLSASDAEFIATARTDVPALVAEVRRLREEMRHLRSQNRGMDLALAAWQHDAERRGRR